MKRLLLALSMVLGVGFGVFHAAPASAAVTCTDYRTLNPSYSQNYPNNGHMYVCFTGYDPNRVTSIINSAGKTGTADNNLMSTKGVNYFYFKDRADAISWMSSPLNLPYYTQSAFQGPHSRCGNTAYVTIMGISTVASEIYDKCTLDNDLKPAQTITNPSLADTTYHESGHAFDFTWSIYSGNPKVPVSTSVGYKHQVAGINVSPTDRSDLFILNLGNANMQPPTTCSLFGDLLPTLLEQDLGSPNKMVCNQSQQQLNYTGDNNSTIAGIVAPYFLLSGQAGAGSLYEELFAQEFAMIYGDDGTLLPRVNKFAPTMVCSFSVVYRLVGYQGTPGDPYNPNPAPCPPASESDYRN